MSGHARTMMVMFKVMLLHKVILTLFRFRIFGIDDLSSCCS